MSHKFIEAQANFIRKNVKGIGNVELTQLFNSHFKLNLKLTQIKAFKKNHKLGSGLDGRFKTGQVSFNKGLKGIWFEGSEQSWFKKGHIPVNHRAVGSERVTVDDYTEVKVAEPNKWRLKQRVIWEKCNGDIPKGHVIIFGDGDRHNLDIGNLILVSRQQLSILNKNKLIQNDVDLTRTGIIIADLYQKIRERGKA